MIKLSELHRLLCEWIEKHYNEQLQTEKVSQEGADNWTYQQGDTIQQTLSDALDRVFLISTTTPRVITHQGVEINHLHYWSPIFNDLNLQGQRVLVKYDLENLNSAWVCVNEQWIECFSKY